MFLCFYRLNRPETNTFTHSFIHSFIHSFTHCDFSCDNHWTTRYILLFWISPQIRRTDWTCTVRISLVCSCSACELRATKSGHIEISIRSGVILCCRLSAIRYRRMAVGLDNVSPWDSAPVWLQYALCGRLPRKRAAVPTNFTITCSDVGNANRYRYVILQGATNSARALCLVEVQVLVNGKHYV